MSVYPAAATWTEQATSAADAAVTVTHAGTVNFAHYITAVIASFDIVPTGGKLLEIKDGATVIVSIHVSDPPILVLSVPIRLSVGNDVIITLASGGAGVVGKLNVTGYTGV